MAVAEAAAQDADSPATPNKGGRRKLILFGAPVLLLGAIGGGLWFTGILGHLLGHDHAKAKKAPQAPIFVDMPEMIANLNTDPRQPGYIKLKARLEVARKRDVAIVKAAMPRLQDLFQTYLRDMRPADLRGAMGTYRLREELINRADIAAAPAKIKDVLFIEMIVQ